jgi:hypothetical protein
MISFSEFLKESIQISNWKTIKKSKFIEDISSKPSLFVDSFNFFGKPKNYVTSAVKSVEGVVNRKINSNIDKEQHFKTPNSVSQNKITFNTSDGTLFFNKDSEYYFFEREDEEGVTYLVYNRVLTEKSEMVWSHHLIFYFVKK